MHRPTNPDSTEIVVARGIIRDDYNIIADTLFYFPMQDSEFFLISLPHDSVISDTYYYHIPPYDTATKAQLFLWAMDDSSADSSSNPYWYLVGKLNVLINEIYYDSPGDDSCCFIEFKDSPGISLDNWRLVGVNGYNGEEYVQIELSGYTMPSDSYFVIAQDAGVPDADMIIPDANLQNGPDNLQLRYYYATWQGVIINGVGYGDFSNYYFAGEWESTVDVAPGHSIGRMPNGRDTDNNLQDFYDFGTPTPGEPNIGVEESKIASNVEFTIFPTITNRALKTHIPNVGRVQIYDPPRQACI